MAPNKQHALKTQDATRRNKLRFLKLMCEGFQPAMAADRCHLATSTVYAWKANDPEFSQAWLEAHDLGLDRLERKVYVSGLRGNASNAQFILKGRRKDVFGQQHDDQRAVTNNGLILQITDAEHRRRLERFGLVQRVIETDYEDDNVAVPTRAGNGSSSSDPTDSS